MKSIPFGVIGKGGFAPPFLFWSGMIDRRIFTRFDRIFFASYRIHFLFGKCFPVDVLLSRALKSIRFFKLNYLYS